MSDILILIPQFIDRAGRMVYKVYRPDISNGELNAGDPIGSVRLDEDELDDILKEQKDE